MTRGTFLRPSLMAVGCSLVLFLVACSNADSKGADSSVQDFSGPQLMGHGMAPKTVSLTFDDGPGPRTAELSRFLKAEGVQGTFFVQGSAVAGDPAAVKQLYNDGHLVANHSYTHPRMTKTTDPVAEVRSTDALIKSYVDSGHFLFRAPYGDWNGRVASILNAAGLTKYVGSVFWDIGGVRKERSDGTLETAADWACWSFNDSVEKCLEGYMEEIRELNRGIVLIHDVHSRSIDMTKLLVKALKEEGFGFIRADEAPAIVEALAERSSKGDDAARAERKMLCPSGFTATPVGQAGALLCLSDKEAQGPFSEGMQAACREKGGGSACSNARWTRGLAVWLHGSGRCPAGASFDAQLNACIEGDNAFGPFSEEQVKRCRDNSADSSSAVCQSNRWSRAFLAGIGVR